ncbi:MAG: galactose-1-epimerase [Candidatus Marinimicrobia bacterium]|nr:galactose-1-epimerase [Candidatus Neomarinimicrobiota bacterium]
MNQNFLHIFNLIIAVFLVSCSSMKENSITIVENSYGSIEGGKEVSIFSFKNRHGLEMEVINYGAIVTTLRVPDRKGELADVVLGFDNIEQYVMDKSYFGAICGRVGNRIADGKFNLDGKDYNLAKNDNGNHLHGGINGFNKRVWTPTIIKDDGIPALKLFYLSEDGEEGYPGNLSISVIYSLTDKNELKIVYEATTDELTVLNPTHHGYFNLSGAGEGNILDHELWINADRFTPVREGLIPTGELRNVTDTPMDFRKETRIGKRIDEDNVQLQLGLGYDHNWVLNDWDNSLRLAVTLYEPISGRFMEVLTTEPGMQFYSGNFLDGSVSGKLGKKYLHRSALCLEADHFPDSVNQPDFPTVSLSPNDIYNQTTIYRFSIK